MNTVLVKLKPIFLLLSMSLVSIGIVWVTNQFKDSSEYVSDEVEAFEEQVLVEETTTEQVELDSSVPSEVTKAIENGYVLNANTSSYQCKNISNFTKIESSSICNKGGTQGNVGFIEQIIGAMKKDGYVSVYAGVVLTKVTVPLELLSGIEVADSNRLITSKTPTLKPAGEQIDSTSANVLLPPGTQINTYKSWEEDTPFKFDYKTAFSAFTEAVSEDSVSEKGEIGVEEELGNECEECNNKSNVNPDKSNKISEFMLDSLYLTPGEKGEMATANRIESCSETDTFEEWTTGYSACNLGLPERTIEFVKSIPGWGENFGDIVRCKLINSKNDPNCIKKEDIVVIMSSPFGSDIDCVNGTCTNAYMESRNSSALAPSASLSGKHYYLTPCEAMIQGEYTITEIKCAWDMSHLFKERKLNELDDLPGVESTPTDEEYNRFLLNDVKGTRGDAVPIN